MRGCRGMGIVNPKKLPKAMKKGGKVKKSDCGCSHSKTKMKKGGSVKDDCYHRVKSSYKVFPSAYASGAIAKCRKNKGKK